MPAFLFRVEKAHYLLTVLRCRKGDNLIIFDGSGTFFTAVIREARKQEVIVEILESSPCVQEAIQCYKAGAFRQAIVATWIAIVYDIIHKLQELELTGNANATRHLEQYERIRQANDLRGSLEFERKILDIAKKDVELISDIEYVDLARLQEDRNRCAHPAMNLNDEIYQPSPELARTHLRNAIEHLLQGPPVQGKAALSRLLADVASEYFPTIADDAVKYFSPGPLANPRASLVRNFVIDLTKEFLDIQTDEFKRKRILSALSATMHIHRGIAQATIADKLNEIIVNLPDDALHLAVPFIFHVPNSWDYLGEDSTNRIKTLIINLPYEHESTVLFYALNIRELQNDAERRLETVHYFSLAQIVRQEKDAVRPSLVRNPVQSLRSTIKTITAAPTKSPNSYLAGRLYGIPRTATLALLKTRPSGPARTSSLRLPGKATRLNFVLRTLDWFLPFNATVTVQAHGAFISTTVCAA